MYLIYGIVYNCSIRYVEVYKFIISLAMYDCSHLYHMLLIQWDHFIIFTWHHIDMFL